MITEKDKLIIKNYFKEEYGIEDVTFQGINSVIVMFEDAAVHYPCDRALTVIAAKKFK